MLQPVPLKFLFHVKHLGPDVDALIEASEALGVPLSPSQAEQLLVFERLLSERAVPFGMIAASDAGRLRQRHVLDCLRAAAEVGAAKTAYDLGSGAGLPGLVVAIAVPALQVGLVESRRRRASFLELAADELGLSNVQVLCRGAEGISERVDLCFARAFAGLPAVWSTAEPLLAPQGRLVYFAGGGSTPEPPPGSQIVEVRSTAVLESAGPLVIMARQ